MHKIIKIRLNKKINNSYEIEIEPGIFKKIAEDLKVKNLGCKYCIITDSNIKKLYADILQKSLEEKSLDSKILSFPSGEKSKNLEIYGDLMEEMIKNNFKRSDCIIALGGGVTGDLAGFIASTFLRGINFVQIPTSLLAMADSSIGGKTGINSSEGKNLIGSFYQPKKVYIDPKILKTLPGHEFKNGIAEIIKHAVIYNKSLFRFVDENSEKIKKGDVESITKMLFKSCKIKSKIISKDDKEKNIRMLLNYGHTIGHAIEKLSNFEISHGEAIAIGIHEINKLALRNNIISHKNLSLIKELLNKFGLSTSIPRGIDIREILSTVKKDKKVIQDKLNIVFAKKIGKAMITDKVALRIIK